MVGLSRVIVVKQAQVCGFTGMGHIIRVKRGNIAKQALVNLGSVCQTGTSCHGFAGTGQIIRVKHCQTGTVDPGSSHQTGAGCQGLGRFNFCKVLIRSWAGLS